MYNYSAVLIHNFDDLIITSFFYNLFSLNEKEALNLIHKQNTLEICVENCVLLI